MKYDIGFVVVSNRPAKLKRFIKSFQHIPILRSKSCMILTHQSPVDVPPNEFDRAVGLPPFDKSKPLPMLQLRRHGIALTSDCKYICYLDDDHQFAPSRPGKTFYKSSEEYYLECIDYMDENQDVGILSLRGYFGGYSWGYGFKKMPSNGFIENNAGGIFMRNIGHENIFPPECYSFVGVMSEPLCGYSIMSQGYKYAKRFNCPNKFEAPGKSKHVSNGAVLSYSEQIANENVQGYIREKFDDPTWRYSDKKYPKGILKIAEQNNWEFNS